MPEAAGLPPLAVDVDLTPGAAGAGLAPLAAGPGVAVPPTGAVEPPAGGAGAAFGAPADVLPAPAVPAWAGAAPEVAALGVAGAGVAAGVDGPDAGVAGFSGCWAGAPFESRVGADIPAGVADLAPVASAAAEVRVTTRVASGSSAPPAGAPVAPDFACVSVIN
ncbi:hypothetical protein GCM10010124_38140 [Pilimelia terevasa]|uniref:Uncharacterized protein n=1 Tax=Pilimelia terevasa TaxID=53372 RepID=A0A8J3BRU8_9ACTN|nr:hypothetical protein GCM10010124_38140 [Pilimelia terevasa]